MTETNTITSWWVDAQKSRELFSRRVAEELPRMQVSKGAVYADAYHAAVSRERGSVGMGVHRKGRFSGVTVSR